jgi:hypothetical protein
VNERYASLVQELRGAVLEGSGATDPALRRAVEARAAALAGGPGEGPGVPPELASFVDTVARHAYRVTREDIDTLRRLGYSEDAIFEIAASAALGAGVGRLERGLAALEGEV